MDGPPEPEPGTTPRFHMVIRGGVGLLSHHGLLVDCRNCRLLDGVTSLSAQGHTAPPSVSSVKVIAGGTSPDSILEKFPELTRSTGIHRELRHNTTHHVLKTSGPPVTCRPRRLSPDRLAVAKAQIDSMLPDVPRDLGHPPSVSCPRTAVGGRVEINEP